MGEWGTGELEIYTKPFDKQRRNAAPRTMPHRTATCGKVSSQAWAPNDAHRSTLSKLQTTLPGNRRARRRNPEAERRTQNGRRSSSMSSGPRSIKRKRRQVKRRRALKRRGWRSAGSAGGLLPLCHMLFNQIQIYSAHTHMHPHTKRARHNKFNCKNLTHCGATWPTD